MTSSHNIYTYHFIQWIIVLAFGLAGIYMCMATSPVIAFALFVAGYVVALAFLFSIAYIPASNPWFAWIFREW